MLLNVRPKIGGGGPKSPTNVNVLLT